MILDPSHIGGSKENVYDICAMAAAYPFDGHLIEMHCDPENAKTDKLQQLSPKELESLLKIIRGPTERREVA